MLLEKIRLSFVEALIPQTQTMLEGFTHGIIGLNVDEREDVPFVQLTLEQNLGVTCENDYSASHRGHIVFSPETTARLLNGLEELDRIVLAKVFMKQFLDNSDENWRFSEKSMQRLYLNMRDGKLQES